jgi:hypothetical protein
MDIKMADFDEFRHIKSKNLKIFKEQRQVSAFDIWAYYI